MCFERSGRTDFAPLVPPSRHRWAPTRRRIGRRRPTPKLRRLAALAPPHASWTPDGPPSQLRRLAAGQANRDRRHAVARALTGGGTPSLGGKGPTSRPAPFPSLGGIAARIAARAMVSNSVGTRQLPGSDGVPRTWQVSAMAPFTTGFVGWVRGPCLYSLPNAGERNELPHRCRCPHRGSQPIPIQHSAGPATTSRGPRAVFSAPPVAPRRLTATFRGERVDARARRSAQVPMRVGSASPGRAWPGSCSLAPTA